MSVVSGDGGKGCVSFRRERFIPRGGPDGGNGGNGGNIIIKASTRLHTLYDFSSKKHFKAKNGTPGKGQNQTGKNGEDVIIMVPLGTIIYDNETDEVLADLIHHDQEVLLLTGGIGGKGNRHFATSTNRVPRFAQPGTPGQAKSIRLSLKYLADIGLIGLPNAGKSTLLSRLTMARPKIDNYPFTTIIPNLGIIYLDDEKSLTIADIPGLIEGASQGKGLGHRFLKHIERTKFLLHIIDITQGDTESVLKNIELLIDELRKFNPDLLLKDKLVLINKIDLISGNNEKLKEIESKLKDMGMDSLPISALKSEGLNELRDRLTAIVT
ncbi:MAG: GTPase ObgE [Deltaproteobacteria bacterium]|nr:GTPase ObgE [Deltaproteobacteria bacterium]